MHIFSAIYIAFVYISVVYSQAVVDIPITVVDNGSGSMLLKFGLDLSATNGIDPHLGESDLPPFPPAGVSEIRFNLTPYNSEPLSSYQDYRNAPSFPYSGNVQHRLWWQLSQGATTITINYNLPSFASVQIMDLFGGVIVNSPVLTGSGSFLITALINEVNLNIVYTNAVGTTDIDLDINTLPKEYGLFQNFPNPFNPGTTITYAIPFTSSTRIEIFNILGELVEQIVDQVQNAGYYEISWDASNLSSGIYIYTIKAESVDGKHTFQSFNKMMLVK